MAGDAPHARQLGPVEEPADLPVGGVHRRLPGAGGRRLLRDAVRQRRPPRESRGTRPGPGPRQAAHAVPADRDVARAQRAPLRRHDAGLRRAIAPAPQGARAMGPSRDASPSGSEPAWHSRQSTAPKSNFQETNAQISASMSTSLAPDL